MFSPHPVGHTDAFNDFDRYGIRFPTLRQFLLSDKDIRAFSIHGNQFFH